MGSCKKLVRICTALRQASAPGPSANRLAPYKRAQPALLTKSPLKSRLKPTMLAMIASLEGVMRQLSSSLVSILVSLVSVALLYAQSQALKLDLCRKKDD